MQLKMADPFFCLKVLYNEVFYMSLTRFPEIPIFEIFYLKDGVPQTSPNYVLRYFLEFGSNVPIFGGSTSMFPCFIIFIRPGFGTPCAKVHYLVMMSLSYL